MKTLTILLPDQLDLSEFEARMLLAGQLYERGKLSLGQGAEFVGLSKRAFIEMLGKFGFSLFGADPSEALEDLRHT